MVFISPKSVLLPLFLGGCGVAVTVPTTLKSSLKDCKKYIRVKQKCYKLFINKDEGEFLACVKKENTTQLNFIVRWTSKESRKTPLYAEVTKIKIEKPISEDRIKVEFPEWNRSLEQKNKNWVKFLGTKISNLEKLTSDDLKKSCKIERQDSEQTPKLTCGTYTQELLYSQEYPIPKILVEK